MHTQDLGVVQEYIGSALWTMVYDSTLPGDALARLNALWAMIRDLYKSRSVRTRLSNLTLSMFTNPRAPHASFPSLSAHAAEARALLPLVVQLCSDVHSGSERDALRLRCGLRLVRFNEVLHSAG
eukprot:1592094-Alexandrium_andersonii.AAC.1